MKTHIKAFQVMSKRSLSDNSDGSDQDDSHSVSDDQEIAAKKRRLVAFETVRLLSVTGVVSPLTFYFQLCCTHYASEKKPRTRYLCSTSTSVISERHR